MGKVLKLLIWTVLGISIFCLIYLMVYNDTNSKTENFYSVKEAEKRIGKIKLPNMPKEYSVNKIQYKDDGFTTPQLMVYYQNEANKELIFLTTSNIAGDMNYEIVPSKSISNLKWVIDLGCLIPLPHNNLLMDTLHIYSF